MVIFLVLLVWWLDISPDVGYDFLDYFSGKARLSLMAEGAGYRVQAYDKSYGDFRGARKGKRSCMDLNSNAGMVLLAVHSLSFDKFAFTCTVNVA